MIKWLIILIAAIAAIILLLIFLLSWSKKPEDKNLDILGFVEVGELISNWQIDKICVFEIKNERTKTFIRFDLKSSVQAELSQSTFIDRPFNIALKSLYNINGDEISASGIFYSDDCHLVADHKGGTWIFSHDWKSAIVELKRKSEDAQSIPN